jgi:type IV fimbrial biogenesis protein FimT
MRYVVRGFSLIELMVVLAIAGILIAAAAPTFVDFIDRARLKGAVDGVASLVSTTRTEAVKRGRDVTVSMGGTTAAWCIGANEAATPAVAAPYATSAACDCMTANACRVDGANRVVAATDHAGVAASAVTANFVVDGKLGNVTSLATTTVDLTSPAGKYTARINISPLAHARVCVPSGNRDIPGYPPC